ncbi:hypothetical protein [Natronomonas marina]|jgi:hypothetical protein|uniref:hypothetical protein n=1 Tax=Natronomonas marina TaxID=2961939 RepID=UPI0020CA166F|nr:hypothetical protein [Natronomonas marina]
MMAWLLPVCLLLTVVAGSLFLVAYLWYRHALRLHAESLFPEDALGVRLLRYGGAAGLASFGGFLLTFVFYLLAAGTGSTAVTATVPLLEVAVGLFLLSLSTFLVAGVGYGTDALRERFGGVR